MAFDVQPAVLEGECVRLEPLSARHAQGLFNCGQQADDWAWMPRVCFADLADCRQWVDEAQGSSVLPTSKKRASRLMSGPIRGDRGRKTTAPSAVRARDRTIVVGGRGSAPVR